MSGFFSYGSAPAGDAAGGNEAPRDILGELGSEDWERFIGHAARRRYPAGAVVVQAGDPAPALCFVASGQVELALPGRRATGRAVRGEGEVFGILGFLDGAPSDVTVTVGAQAPAELLMLTPQALESLAAWHPRIALMLLRDVGAHVAQRLRRLQPGD